MLVPFGEWLPDLAAVSHGGATVARNVLPDVNSYRPLNRLSPGGETVGAPVLGAHWARADSGIVRNFVGTSSALFLQNTTSWTDVSRSPAYSGATNWEFTKFGNRVIAVSAIDDPQYYDLDSSTTFDDLGGSPPRANRIAVVRDFVVLGDLVGEPDTLAWSGFNNSEVWTPDPVTGSDTQRLFGAGGGIKRIVPGDYGVIFTENSIYRMSLDPETIFRFDEIEPGRGTPVGNSVGWFGRTIFYYGRDGFYAFDGRQSTPIGANKVNRWFESVASSADLSSMRCAVDPNRTLVFWAFKTIAGAYNDRLLIYNWAVNRWAYADVTTSLITDFAQAGYTLDELDAVLGGGIDTSSILVDDRAYAGGAPALVAFDSADQIATFSGAALDADLETHEVSGADPQTPSPARRLFVRGARPLVDAPSGLTTTVRLGTRSMLAGSVAYSDPLPMDPSGTALAAVDARYPRVRVGLSGDFNHAIGVELDAIPSGRI